MSEGLVQPCPMPHRNRPHSALSPTQLTLNPSRIRFTIIAMREAVHAACEHPYEAKFTPRRSTTSQTLPGLYKLCFRCIFTKWIWVDGKSSSITVQH